nr:MoaD/ThiS family protein [Tychonema sp. LEGE 07203]
MPNCRSHKTAVSNSSINVTVKLFAAFGEAYGVSEITVELPPETPVSQILERSIAQYPQLQQWRDRTRFGVNLEFVSPDTILQDGDEVVLIPPVSGG